MKKSELRTMIREEIGNIHGPKLTPEQQKDIEQMLHSKIWPQNWTHRDIGQLSRELDKSFRDKDLRYRIPTIRLLIQQRREYIKKNPWYNDL